VLNPERRHGDWIKSIFLLIVVIDFVIVDWSWFLLLLLFLEPAEAKEENKWSYSVIHTDNVAVGSLPEWDIDSFYSFLFRFARLLFSLV
jgi:hypothetical protein